MFATLESFLCHDDSIRQNFTLSRPLLHEQTAKRIIENETTVDVIEFIHVSGSRMILNRAWHNQSSHVSKSKGSL